MLAGAGFDSERSEIELTTASLISLLGWLALCFAAAWLGSAYTRPSLAGWYFSLAKPSWNPPNKIFPAVWILLYAMMGVAAWQVCKHEDRPAVAVAIGFFVIQLILNVLWSIFFFHWRRPGSAFAEICLLWCAILATLLFFAKLDRVATELLIPYFTWVSFAAVLNFAIWRKNS